MIDVSNKPKEIVDACRFCWMCRHICPIGNVTGQERNNARARALSLSMVNRGAAKLSDSIANNVYECALCGACTKDCATGWDPVIFTKDARLSLALDGNLPEHIDRLLENIEQTGNPYGITRLDSGLRAKISALPKSAKTLLFLGTDARYMIPRAAINAIKLLEKTGAEFTVLMDEPDSGAVLDTLVGAAEETRVTMQKAAETLSGYETVIAFDPADAKVFLREYKEWHIPMTCAVKTFTSHLAELVNSGAIKAKKLNKTAAIQDPAALSRDLEETGPLRDIVSARAHVKEMMLHGKDTVWAGNLLMNEWLPRVMALTAKERWRNALAAGADMLVTASPSEYEVLAAEKPDGIDLVSIEELLL